MFMDGVIETNTAFMLAPYAERSGDARDAQLHGREEFKRMVAILDRRGWQIMVHGLGDGAVRDGARRF